MDNLGKMQCPNKFCVQFDGYGMSQITTVE